MEEETRGTNYAAYLKLHQKYKVRSGAWRELKNKYYVKDKGEAEINNQEYLVHN